MDAQSEDASQAFPSFRERPPWIGRDLQTLRNFLRGDPGELLGGERLLLAMPDGDKLAARLDRPIKQNVIYFKRVERDACEKPVSAFSHRALVVLVHGLAGCESSHDTVATARHLVSEGWSVLRLNLRGSEPSRPTSTGRYHAGRTEDLEAALRALPRELALHGIILVGHSLGGNLVLKFMGEAYYDLPVLAAAAISTPLDLAGSCARMMERRNLPYHRHMLRAMKLEALAESAALTSVERATIAAARNVYEFDNNFVAPHFGYRDALDYYEANRSGRFLAGIKTPTLIVHALDDPWIPSACYTTIDWARLPMIETALTPNGGHLGFHGVGSATPWHDRVTALWLSKQAAVRLH
ncbi:alpha/beta hydrolase [Methylocystis bryophila]|uniref:Alpha/beta hydrolase n=1 Tax=Methylocystis bryophila TaxID=655015 RepID=A0A1W6N180_9HYPH|nr:alpha/beta hydrolase [Methylocystis bryophila]